MHDVRDSEIRRLPVIDATPTVLEPYGCLITPGAQRAAQRSSFYGDAVELWAQPGFVSDADTCLSVARVQRRPNEVTWLERHFKHTQVFVPLGARPFVMVLGAPTSNSLPDLATVRALRFDGRSGVLLRIGTWHEFPFAVDSAVDLLVILRHETTRDLQQRAHDEAVGGDLEKRNLPARLGLRLVF
ncbi:MAG: ureidoglycolate lyase [Steroidobacteraceae bacterium]|nr:ureidoglycolate lyase [Steroidobacteraceae bacterium]MDW8257901.1 ureidoglycolate lyase [Gammaproteobacteria bacterium]